MILARVPAHHDSARGSPNQPRSAKQEQTALNAGSSSEVKGA
jgi:hypothetical protein